MRKSFLLVFIVLLLSSLSVQALTIETYGVSPRDAEMDSLDIFDRAYNGLENVGVETKVYLKGVNEDAALSAAAWQVIEAPAGSNAAIGDVADIDENTQIVSFIPDVTGTFVLQFADGSEFVEITINAGTYVGIEQGGCAMCHKPVADKWKETGHADMLVRGLNGELAAYYGANCISCHTVGFDADANNDGFDDRDFVFPPTKGEGVYDATKLAYPNAMKLANIQCESCHGPGSEHYGDASNAKMVSTLDSKNCAWCHDAGTHHIFPYQWDVSKHGNPSTLSRGGSTSCAPCHSGSGFVAWVKGGKSLSAAPTPEPISCAVCHDPHDATNPNQLRLLEPVELGNGVVIEDGGKGLLCMTCHKGRRNVDEYTGPDFSYSSHFGPHHGCQTDVLTGNNAATFGKVLPSSPHLQAAEDACVTCHMAGAHSEEVPTVGGHSFWMINPETGENNVAACESCHGDIGETFAEKKYFKNGVADHDGDGVEEGLQEEIHGMLHDLAMMLPPVDTAEVDMGGDYIYTITEVKAAFNWFLIEEDRSGGIHNPAFAVALLNVSKQALLNNALEGDIVAIDDVPNDQGKQVRIIWGKMVDDGVSADPVSEYLVKRQDSDDVWVTVGSHVADGSPRYALVVPTVWDSTAAGSNMTTFKVVALTQSGMTVESTPAAGYSVDNLVPGAPANVAATMISGSEVMLSWDESVDEDFNYFAVYRGEESGFEPGNTNLVGTLTGVEFTDAELAASKTYYYKVEAVDFSGNRSESSAEVSVLVTGVAANNANVPTEFSLDQNYPNPFNPSTTINFGVPGAEHVTITVFDIRGAQVRTLTSARYGAGYHTVVWDGRDQNGIQVANGTYMYRLESETASFTKKMLFLK